jgi:hypothetical protein
MRVPRRLPLMLQAALGDGVAFDPFSLQQDDVSASEVDVGRGRLILQPIALINKMSSANKNSSTWQPSARRLPITLRIV